MNAPVSLVAVAPAPTDFIALVAATPQIVLTDPEVYTAWKAMVVAESAKAGTDVSTAKARDVIRAAARKIVSSKTAIDTARKGLTEDYRAKVAEINRIGGEIVEEVAALAADVRKPLTDWEEADKAREAAAEAFFDRLKIAGTVTLDDTAAGVAARLAEITALEVDAETFGDYADRAREVRDKTKADLGIAIDRLTQAEAERAELQRMRDAEAKRAADAILAEQAAQAERDAEAARQAEQSRIAEAAERAKTEAAAEAAKALVAAQQQAADALKAQQDAHAAELAKIEADAQAERDRQVEAARQKAIGDAEALRVEERRQQNRRHQSSVMSAARVGLMKIDRIDDALAEAIVQAIVAGAVPNVTLQF